MGREMILAGSADVVVCGGVEAGVQPFSLAAFAAARAMSTRNDEPERASRPFDVDRDGFVMGEGSTLLVLEARGPRPGPRGGRARRRLGCGADVGRVRHRRRRPREPGPHHHDGAAVGGPRPEDVGLVHAHATATPSGTSTRRTRCARHSGCRRPSRARRARRATSSVRRARWASSSRSSPCATGASAHAQRRHPRPRDRPRRRPGGGHDVGPPRARRRVRVRRAQLERRGLARLTPAPGTMGRWTSTHASPTSRRSTSTRSSTPRTRRSWAAAGWTARSTPRPGRGSWRSAAGSGARPSPTACPWATPSPPTPTTSPPAGSCTPSGRTATAARRTPRSSRRASPARSTSRTTSTPRPSPSRDQRGRVRLGRRRGRARGGGRRPRLVRTRPVRRDLGTDGGPGPGRLADRARRRGGDVRPRDAARARGVPGRPRPLSPRPSGSPPRGSGSGRGPPDTREVGPRLPSRYEHLRRLRSPVPPDAVPSAPRPDDRGRVRRDRPPVRLGPDRRAHRRRGLDPAPGPQVIAYLVLWALMPNDRD